MGSLNAARMWMCIALLTLCSSSGSTIQAVEAKKRTPPKKLVLFEHEDRVDPGRTVVTTASPSIASTGGLAIQFGAINVVNNVVRTGIENTSTVLGKAVGQVTFEIDLSLSLAFSFVLNTTDYAGTIAIQGVLDANGNGELVVTGGTHDFRLVRGYCETLTVSTDPADFVFKNTLYLDYPAFSSS